MGDSYVCTVSSTNLPMWARLKQKRVPLSFDLELTPRCNNNCKHCYINLPADDAEARRRELTVAEIDAIVSQAVDLGTIWCLITGGEPLLRKDFAEVYLLLKKRGLLVSVFTNACLVTQEHVELFQKYPPRDLEVTVYGATEETYERVTRKHGSYKAFRRGLDLLIAGGVKVQLKAMALRSNVHEIEDIARFSRLHSSGPYRFDPLLHLRYDGDEKRNAEIVEERLSPVEIAAVEQANPERSAAMQRNCDQLFRDEVQEADSTRLFYCGAGLSTFSVGYDGMFRLCSSLNHPGSIYNIRQHNLVEAWSALVPQVRAFQSANQDFREHCGTCPLVNLCLWCPAHAYLEVGRMDGRSPYFCQVANARAAAVQKKSSE